MKSLVIFVLLHNTPIQQNEVFRTPPIPFEQCDAMQRSVWSQSWPEITVEGDKDDWPTTDAACLPIN